MIETIDPLGGRWKKEYDTASRIVAEENPLGERTTHQYDADGRLIRTVDPLGRAKQFLYDADSNQVAQIEPDGTVRAKAYNTKNDVIAEEAIAGDPATRIQYVRDVAGKIVQYIDERGNPRSYGYNVKGGQCKVALRVKATSFPKSLRGQVYQPKKGFPRLRLRRPAVLSTTAPINSKSAVPMSIMVW